MAFVSKKQVFLVVSLLLISVAFFVVPSPMELHAKEKEIVINKNVSKTYKREVTLSLNAPDGTSEMKLSNDVFFPNAKWEKYAATKKWTVPVGKGMKSVYVRFKDSKGKVADVFYHDFIALDIPDKMTVAMAINENDDSVKTRNVSLEIEYSAGIEKMFISNDATFTDFNSYTPTDKIPWILSNGSGEKTVYMQFLDANGDTTTISDKIEYTEPLGTLPPGTLMKSNGTSIYYLGFDGKIHPFLHSAVFHSWYANMNAVKIKNISPVALKQYNVGKPICVRGGTWLVRFQNFPQLYAVETGCRLFPLRSEVEAHILHGSAWKQRVITLNNLESGTYSTYDRGVNDPDNEIKDFDNDGLDVETEKTYGTSDTLPDTDGDGLSDIEEVFAWFTDPTNADTDENGVGDMKDVLDTYVIPGQSTDMSDVYMYPSELVLHSGGKYYMNYSDHLMYFLAKKVSDSAFTTNKFIKRFIVGSSPFIPVSPRSGWHIKANSHILKNPSLVNSYGNLQAL